MRNSMSRAETPRTINNIAQQAIDAFQDVLKMDPSNTTALASIAQIYYNMKKFDEAKDYNQRRIKIEPNNPEPYYWIGVLDWAITWTAAQTLRKDHSLDAAKDPAHPDLLPVIPDKLPQAARRTERAVG